tara:strand:+ start:787 stop:1341 length:555 start_codon:yes stop_codon:yes gene_type:complete
MLIINETTKTNKNNDICVFTDGSALNNQSKDKSKTRAGVGVFFGESDKRNISFSLNKKKNGKYIYKKTNQVAEVLAIIMGIETVINTELLKKRKIIIYTDSMYCINIITKWAKNWEKNSWKKSNGKIVENIELIKKMYYLAVNLKVRMVHVKAHKKEPKKDNSSYFTWYGNMMADKLATSASSK